MADRDDIDDALLEDYFGPLEPVWTSDSGTDDDGRRYVTVPVTKLYGDPLYGKLRGVRVDQGAEVWVRLVAYSDQTGAPVTFSLGQYSTPPAVQVRYREASGYDPRIYVPDDADTPGLSSDGKSLLLPLPNEVKDQPAVYDVQARVVDSTGLEKLRTGFTLLLERGLWARDGTAPPDRGPPTVAEIRTALRDHPGANRLLGDFEFDPAEVGQALTSAVQHYDQEAPTGSRNFTTATFPAGWRRQWLDGALATLFETAASYHRRGMLPYQAAGLAVNDLAKEKDYVNAAQFYRERFSRWCKIMKTRASISAGWGSVAGGPTYHGGWDGGW